MDSCNDYWCMFTIINVHDRIENLAALQHTVGAGKRKYYLCLLYKMIKASKKLIKKNNHNI